MGSENSSCSSLFALCSLLFAPQPPPCPAGFVLRELEPAFHAAAISIIEPRMRKALAHQFFVKHSLAMPYEREKPVVAIFALQAESETYAVIGVGNEVLRESAGLWSPWFDCEVFADRFGRVDTLQPHAGAGGEQQSISIDDA